jgi:prolyl oligopeptidase
LIDTLLGLVKPLPIKLGNLKYLNLEIRLKEVLGDKYDIKEFHDEVLKRGSLPLDLLEYYIDEWINLTLAS